MFKKSFGLRRTERAEKNYDVHKITGSQMFGVPVEEVTPELRKIGKTLRHATNYSAGPGVVATRVGCTMPEGKRLLEIFFNSCPQLRLWHEAIQMHLRSSRVLTNLQGRKHWFLSRYGDQLFRSAYSYKPQSTVGELLNESLCDHYYNHGDFISLAFQLHDAMYDLVPDEDIPRAMDTMRQAMIRPLYQNGIEFYIDVDFAIGKSWGTLEEIEWQDYCSPETIEHSDKLREKMLGDNDV
jgi:DNA polymerase-1